MLFPLKYLVGKYWKDFLWPFVVMKKISIKQISYKIFMNRENDVDIYLSIFAQDIFLSIINNKYYIENDNLLRKRYI